MNKIKRRLWRKIVSHTRNTSFYPYIYRSYWHCLLHKNKEGKNTTCYYTACPNPGAGIGHQMANWIAGYWYARQFGLKFAHLSFSTKKWNEFLGFGENEITVSELKRLGYKIRRLPLFDEKNKDEYDLNRRIIASYVGRRIVFIAEQDQFYKNQYEVMEDLKHKFYSASSRKNDKVIYSKDNFNIAIHVRRGDIMSNPENPNLAIRYLSNDYFEKVLQQVITHIKVDKPIHIYFFSQGNSEDYPEFAKYENLHWCMDMGAPESFLHMVCADLLITSKSSFSYKPALLNKGLKVCPRNFWHGYPDTDDWIMVENDGEIVNKTILRQYIK